MILTELEIYYSMGVCFILMIQTIYYFLYFYNIQSNGIENHQSKPASIIVCAHNELENLEVLIPILLSQNHPNYELIVVNDRSTDETQLYLEQVRDLDSRLKIVKVEEQPQNINSKKYAITLAVKAASFDYVYFTDADCIPNSNDWLSKMESCFNDNIDIVLGYSGYESEPGFLNKFIQFETVYTALQYLGFASKGKTYMGVGRNMAYKKRLFFENKGFHPYNHIMGGDDDLFISKIANKTNVAIMVDEDSQILSKPKTSFGDWYRQKKRHLSVSKLYKSDIKVSLSVLHFTHIFFYLMLIPLFFMSLDTLYVALTIYFIRILLIFMTFNRAFKIFNNNLSIFWVLIFDWIFIVYLSIIGFNALTAKQIKWS